MKLFSVKSPDIKIHLWEKKIQHSKREGGIKINFELLGKEHSGNYWNRGTQSKLSQETPQNMEFPYVLDT